MATGLFRNKAAGTGMWRGREGTVATEGVFGRGDPRVVGFEVCRRAHVKRLSPLWSRQQGPRVQAVGICWGSDV